MDCHHDYSILSLLGLMLIKPNCILSALRLDIAVRTEQDGTAYSNNACHILFF